MCKALSDALDIFRSSTDPSKVLFIFSDGESTDGDPAQFAEQLHKNKVMVFSCLLTSENISHARRLHYELDVSWTKAQQQMFQLSSTVENTHSAMSVLLEQGWELPASGHSRLFIQANHPDVINEYSSLVQQLTRKNNALLNIIGRVSLDIYVNAAISSFEPRLQRGGTCYAHAVAAVFHLAMQRIEGRENGVPEFEDICQDMIGAYGIYGAVIEKVLMERTPGYRLHYKGVNEDGARQAINHRRPVVAAFSLDARQWENFSVFYKNSPQGVLQSKHIEPVNTQLKIDGHAVVLVKCEPTVLTFMNSWGKDFADGGFFRVQNQAVLGLQFYDVYWTVNDLKQSEITAFAIKSNQKGEDILRGLPRSIQNLPYECPKCHQSSPAIQFIGYLLEAECPRCHQRFEPTALGFLLN